MRPPSRNLLLDGYEDVAAFIARQIKSQSVAHTVHVSDSGAVHLTRARADRPNPRWPVEWMVGTYPCRGLRVEYIEDDLLARQREIAA